MKKLLLIHAFLGFGLIGIAQPKFTAATLDEYNKALKNNPVETIKQGVHRDFQFINGKGEVNNYNALLNFFTYFTEIERTITDLKINQFGNSAITMGTLTHAWHPKDDTKSVSRYTGKFTYTYVYDNGKWMQTSAQHTDIAASKEQDEAAIKQVIEGQTKASWNDRNLEKTMSYWAKVPEASFNIPSMNAYVRGYDNVKVVYTYYMKNNPTPDNTKIDYVYHSIRINGNSAWVNHDEVHNRTNGTVGKNNCYRYLEKINGEWKLVSYVTTPATLDQNAEKEAVRKAIEAESNAYYKGDVAAWKAAWANNAYTERQHENLKKLVQSPYLKGAALVKAHEEYAKTHKSTGQSFKISDFEAHMAGNTAWATYTQETLKADGSLDYKERGLRILEKINGEWKLVMMSFTMF